MPRRKQRPPSNPLPKKGNAPADCAVRIDTARKREADLNRKLSESEETTHQAQSRHEAAQGDLDGLNKQIGEIEAKERALRQIEEALTADSRRADLEGRIEVLRELAGNREPIEGELRSIKVTAQDCKVLDDLERELSTLDGRLEAGAARVEVEILPAGAGKVTLDHEVVRQGTALPLLAPTTITVSDLARIKASPPAAFGRQELARRRSLEEQLANLLAKAAVVSVAQLRQAYARRSELETQRDGVLAQLRALGVQPDEAANAIAKAATDVAALDAMITQAMKASNLAVLPTASVVAEQLRVLTSDREALRATAQAQTGLLDAQRRILTDAGGAVASLRVSLTNCGVRLAVTSRGCQTARESHCWGTRRRRSSSGRVIINLVWLSSLRSDQGAHPTRKWSDYATGSRACGAGSRPNNRRSATSISKSPNLRR